MISEKEFAEGFTGFWTECLPFLTPQLIAELNLNGSPMPDSKGFVAKPLKSANESASNDIVAEIAFGLFAASCSSKQSVISIFKNTVLMNTIGESAHSRILALRGHAKFQQSNIEMLRFDALELAVRLEDYFDRESTTPVVVQPRLKGCGILNSCYGDIFSDGCLYEVKMVDRNLRSVDLRQVLTYCALNYQAQQLEITSACILNPRRGIAFRFKLEVLAQRASGKNSAELFHQILEFLGNFQSMHQAS